MFVYADDIWFAAHSLVELAGMFYKEGGKALYIDEIHKYRNWSQKIKNIYDSYPGLKVFYTGSSVLDLQKGNHDLSRRLLEYKMSGLSFREFLAIKYGVILLFKEYLKAGSYPFFVLE